MTLSNTFASQEIQSLKDKISDLEIINTNLERDLRQEFEHRLQSDLSEARARLDKLAAAQKNEYECKMRQKLKQAQVWTSRYLTVLC